jgi:hypothetical protein
MIRELVAGVNAANAIAHNQKLPGESIARIQQREFWEVEIGDMATTRTDCTH